MFAPVRRPRWECCIDGVCDFRVWDRRFAVTLGRRNCRRKVWITGSGCIVAVAVIVAGAGAVVVAAGVKVYMGIG